MHLILPKKFIDKATIQQQPLFFIAGPVLGGDNWQEKCCEELAKCLPRFFAVVPCNWGYSTKLSNFFVNGVLGKFPDQTSWEYHYLKLANELSEEHRGCIIFWLPVESKEHPRVGDSPYAGDTRGELGRWSKDAAWRGGHIVVGAESGFPRWRNIQRQMELDFNLPPGEKFPIYPTLQETVLQAVQWVI